MHKGYAFVQFTNPFDARNACHGEDGRTVLSQTLGKLCSTLCTIFVGRKVASRGLCERDYS